MAITSRSLSNWVLLIKVFLVLSLIFAIGMILKFSVPVILQQLPLFWRCILSWLTPPYLYLVVNGIIITIAASSKFYHHNKIDEEPQSSESIVSAPVPAPLKVPVMNSSLDFSVSSGYDDDTLIIKSPVEVRSEFFTKNNTTKTDYEILDTKFFKEQQEEKESNVIANPVSEREEEQEEEEGFVISRSSWTASRRREIEKENIFPAPVSGRFSHHRRTVKSSPEAGKVLGVAKPKRHDTLERTWKTITDGRPIPLARHLKKSDTWETHGRHHHNHNHSAGSQQQTPPTKTMNKCETFQDRNKNPASPLLSPSPGSGKLKKEPSLSQDELNRRVEAFIKKFNEDMRLQRQESLNQYKDMMMVNRR